MKIAILHDYFGSIGGGEKMVLEIAKSLKADIYTTEMNHANIRRINAHGINIRLLGNGCTQFPILKQIHSSILFYNADLRRKGYDFYIMSGNWSIFACRKHHPNLHYVHTPPRMFYDSKDFFYEQAPWYGKIPFLIWVFFHRIVYEKQLRHVDRFVANSKNVQKRIKKYYHERSDVIYPPIKGYKFIRYGDFWLSVNRFYPHKRLELQIEAFRKMPEEKLLIIGGHMKGDNGRIYYKRITKNLPKNVRIVGEVDEKTLDRLYGTCRGFITTSKDEDFGMTVLEAMSAGKPVIAANEGGYRETVINGKTGMRIHPRISDLVAAVNALSKKPWKHKSDCIRQAQKFDVETFIKKMKMEIRLEK